MNKYFVAISPFIIIIAYKLSHMLGIKTICIWYLLTGHKCLGCGITTAIVYLLQGKYVLAYESNHLVYVIFPILLYCWLHYIKREFFNY